MEFRNEDAKFNEFYYERLRTLTDLSTGVSVELIKSFLDECSFFGVDFEHITYKKLVDEEEEITIDSKRYTLLPMGLKNSNIPYFFIKPGVTGNDVGRVSLNTFSGVFFRGENYVSLYYPEKEKKPTYESFKKCCASYIEHYKTALDENWSEEDFYKMLSDLKYLSVKYAVDQDTNEVFAVGFFGAAIRNGAGGKALTNAELYVMPEFRHMGIAQRMVGLTFEQAKNDGIENFDSITYRVESNDALAFWEKVGASVSGLTHIEGSIPEILEVIDKNNSMRAS